MAKIAYFVDGYHGGIKGHMPLGAWADVVQQMEQHPNWKLGLDIEPISWDVLKRTDPKSYKKIKTYLKDQSTKARVEMLGGTYAQPFGWVIGGESIIRHLLRGREIIHEHFPEVRIDTYATQEPCWSSCFPQILLSLGYKRAVLKNPGTAWAGYPSGHPKGIVLWVGPDGSSIPCVPRYECEELINCWESEAAYMEDDFIKKCKENNIHYPVGSFLQDLGWPSRPWLKKEEIVFVTWREYFEEIVGPPEEEWHFTQEDIRCTLPWGEGTLQRLAREVRVAENKIIQAEKMASISSVLRTFEYPYDEFQTAWDELLLSQHHDAWICATTRVGRENWGYQAGVQVWNAEMISDDIIERAMDTFRTGEVSDEAKIVVFNTTGIERFDLVEMEIPTPPGTKAIQVLNQQGEVLESQLVPTRVYQFDQSVNAGKLLFQAKVPAMGYQAFTVKPVKEPVLSNNLVQVHDDFVTISTDIYDIEIDIERGGVMTKLYDKELKKNFVADGAVGLNEYKGYFIKEERFISSTETPVKVFVKEKGPIRAKVTLVGKIANVDIHTTISLTKGERRIDFQVQLHYKEKTWIGDPWDIDPENRNTERRKSHHNEKYKLQALFPVSLANQQLYKNSAFDVTKSRHEDTYFTRYDEIKHNIILHWIDLYDEKEDCGFAIFSDHTTGYSHSQDGTFGYTLGWGWEGGFWWGKCPLEGYKEINYSILPHKHRWDEAGIHQEYTRMVEPFLLMYTTTKLEAETFLHVSDPAVEVSTMIRDGNDLLVRLFNSVPEAKTINLTVKRPVKHAELVELDGKFKEPLALKKTDKTSEATISLNGFGLSTIRLCEIN